MAEKREDEALTKTGKGEQLILNVLITGTHQSVVLQTAGTLEEVVDRLNDFHVRQFSGGQRVEPQQRNMNSSWPQGRKRDREQKLADHTALHGEAMIADQGANNQNRKV